jgi:dihydrofolate reductase
VTADLLYFTMTSIDGYIEDADGDFGWAEPDEEVHRFVNDLVRPVGTHLCGRRLYETMAVWETDPSLAEESEVLADFADLWQRADKVVFSTTLDAVVTGRTTLLRAFDADDLRARKERASRPLSVGGAELAGQAFAAGLVDEYHVVLAPVVVGRGKPAIAPEVTAALTLTDVRRFDASGMVYLRYRVADPSR